MCAQHACAGPLSAGSMAGSRCAECTNEHISPPVSHHSSAAAAVTCISTKMLGRAISAWTVARTGLFSGSTQAFQTPFMALKSAAMSFNQMVAWSAPAQQHARRTRLSVEEGQERAEECWSKHAWRQQQRRAVVARVRTYVTCRCQPAQADHRPLRGTPKSALRRWIPTCRSGPTCTRRRDARRSCSCADPPCRAGRCWSRRSDEVYGAAFLFVAPSERARSITHTHSTKIQHKDVASLRSHTLN